MRKRLIGCIFILICIIYHTDKSYAQAYVEVNTSGARFIISRVPNDTVILRDTITGEILGDKIIINSQLPTRMNGDSIYYYYTPPILKDTPIVFFEFLLSKVKGNLVRLPDDEYVGGISEMVVDTNGRVAYFRYMRPERGAIHSAPQPMPKNRSLALLNKIKKVLPEMLFEVAIVNGKKVVAGYDGGGWGRFKVKEHQLSILPMEYLTPKS